MGSELTKEQKQKQDRDITIELNNYIDRYCARVVTGISNSLIKHFDEIRTKNILIKNLIVLNDFEKQIDPYKDMLGFT